MRKILSLVLAFALILGSFPLAFADAATSGAQLQEWKIVQGDLMSDKDLTREMAITYFIRLLGEEQAALAYAEPTTFTDVPKTHWAYKYIAYAEAKKYTNGMGNGKFGLGGTSTTQHLIAFILRGLGYGEVAYADVVAKATELKLLTNVTTNADVKIIRAVGFELLINALNTPMKGQTVALKYVLKLATVPTSPVTMDSVKAVTNSLVDVKVLEANAVTVAPALTTFKIVDKDAKAVEVTAVELRDAGKTLRLTTAAQVPGALYKITVGEVTKEFVGLVKDTVKPVVSTVVAKTNTIVEVTYAVDDLDPKTSVDVANYSINDLTVVSATVSKAKVTLVTSAQTAGKLYTLTTQNVTDLSANKMDKSEVKFGGKAADTTKPVVATVVSKKGITLEVTFTEDQKLDAATALDIANYTVEGVAITAAVMKNGTDDKTTNDFDKSPIVVLTTATQTAGKLYTLTVQNVKDAAGNVIAKQEVKFGGTALDTTKPEVTLATATANTTVEVTFGEDDLAADTAKNIANYVITDLAVTAAEVDGAVVTLTTAPQTSGKLYTLTVENVKDTAGNAITKVEKKFGGMAADTVKPTIASAQALTQNTFQIVFSENVDKTAAQTLSNYVIDGDLGYPTSATYTAATKTVVLGTVNQAAKVYEVAVSNVKDLSGNVITASSKVKFAGIGAALSSLKVDGVVSVDKHTVKVIFNQAINKTNAAVTANYTIKSATDSASNIGTIAGATVAARTASAVATVSGSEVTITFPSTFTMVAGEIYELTVANVTGLHGAALSVTAAETKAQFAGITTAKADLKVDAVNVIDGKTIQITFNQNIKSSLNPVNETTIELYTTEAAVGTTTPAAIGTAVATDEISKNVLTVRLSAAMTANTIYYVNIATASGITDISGLYAVKIDTAATKSEAVFATGTIPTVELKVDAVVMTDVNTLEVYFNNEVADDTTVADSLVIYAADGTTTLTPAAILVPSNYVVDGKKITYYFTNLGTVTTAGTVYTAKINTLTDVDYKYNAAISILTGKNTAQFAAVDTENAKPYMVGAAALANNKVRVTLSEEIVGITTSAIKVVKKGTTDVTLVAGTDYTISYTAGNDYFDILATAALTAGTTYEVSVIAASGITGISLQDAIKADDATTTTVNENAVTFAAVN